MLARLIRTKVSENLSYISFLLGELTESGYRNRKLRLEKEILKRDYEEGMYSNTSIVYQNLRLYLMSNLSRGREGDVGPYR